MDKQGKKRAVARLFSAIGRCQEAPVSGFEPSVRVPKQCRRTARRRGNPSGRGGALQAPHRTRLVLQIWCGAEEVIRHEKRHEVKGES